MPDSVHRVLALGVVKHDYLPDAFANHPRFQIVAVADDPDRPDWTHARNQRYADRHRVPYLRDVASALAACDVAVISSEAERHCTLGLRAAAAGKHLVVDKPLSPDLAECDVLVAAVAAQRVKSLVWNRNMLPALRRAHAVVQDPSILGDIRSVHCDFYFAKDAGPPLGTRGHHDPPINWLDRQREAHADGSDGAVGVTPLGELQVEGIYPLAYIRLLVNSPVTRVFARTATRFHQAHADHHVEDLATVSLEMANGCLGSLCLGRIGAASHPGLGENRIHLVGAAGTLVLDESRPEIAIHSRQQAPGTRRHRSIANENDYYLASNFADAIDHDRDTILDVRGARDIAAVVQAALRSARTGAPVELSP